MAEWNAQFRDGTVAKGGAFYCVGRNYAAHAKEMGADSSAAPLLFIKPPSAYLPPGHAFYIPKISNLVHHEVEMVIMVNRSANGLAVGGIAVGLDMTLRDLQAIAKKNGEPWAVAKGFRGSAPLSPFIKPAELPCPIDQLSIALYRDAQLLQQGAVSDMQWGVERLMTHIDSIFELQDGDCIFTGTPEGVGPVQRGERLTASLSYGAESLTTLALEIR